MTIPWEDHGEKVTELESLGLATVVVEKSGGVLNSLICNIVPQELH
jgi:hypothetical protein